MQKCDLITYDPAGGTEWNVVTVRVAASRFRVRTSCRLIPVKLEILGLLEKPPGLYSPKQRHFIHLKDGGKKKKRHLCLCGKKKHTYFHEDAFSTVLGSWENKETRRLDKVDFWEEWMNSVYKLAVQKLYTPIKPVFNQRWLKKMHWKWSNHHHDKFPVVMFYSCPQEEQLKNICIWNG